MCPGGSDKRKDKGTKGLKDLNIDALVTFYFSITSPTLSREHAVKCRAGALVVA
jgi:hypothetical protein